MPLNLPPWPDAGPDVRASLERCLDSGQWGRYHSEICGELETRLTNDFSAAQARLCCSGTAALEVALRACRIGAGAEVIVAAFDYPGNFRTVELLAARPVLVDVQRDSVGLDEQQLEAAASANVRAVIASHLYGVAANVESLRRQCDERGWILIEDACQVAGMRIAERPAGSFGHVSTLSFGGSKLISAGSGGALLVHSDQLAARLGGLIDRPGDTFPLSPLQAAVIGPQWDRLAEMNQRRDLTARFIESELNSRLPKWKWQSGAQDDVAPAYYKVAWTAQSNEHRGRIVAASDQSGLPIGAGFRSLSGCSERRCRKPIPTPQADWLGETLFVLDQRALLLPSSQHDELANALIELHDQT